MNNLVTYYQRMNRYDLVELIEALPEKWNLHSYLNLIMKSNSDLESKELWNKFTIEIEKQVETFLESNEIKLYKFDGTEENKEILKQVACNCTNRRKYPIMKTKEGKIFILDNYWLKRSKEMNIEAKHSLVSGNSCQILEKQLQAFNEVK